MACPAIYIVLALMTVYYHGKRLVCTNIALMVTWFLDSAFKLTVIICLYSGLNVNAKIKAYVISMGIDDTTFIMFLAIIFRLKAMQIYMDD